MNGLDYLKDYSYTYVYNKSGNSQFLQEQVIYCSDYFIKKLRSFARRWHIDCTFIVPSSFKQLLVILYRDDYSGVRYRGL